MAKKYLGTIGVDAPVFEGITTAVSDGFEVSPGDKTL